MKREPTLQLKELEHRFSSQCCHIYFNFINNPKISKETKIYYCYEFDWIFKHLLSWSIIFKKYINSRSPVCMYSKNICHFVGNTANAFCDGGITFNYGKLIVFYKYNFKTLYINKAFPYAYFVYRLQRERISYNRTKKINEDSLCDFILNHSNIKQNELCSVIEKNLFKLM